MNPTIKTDKYINSLKDVLDSISIYCYEYPCYVSSAELLSRLNKAHFKSMLLSGSLTLGEIKANETSDRIMTLFDYSADYKPMVEQIVMYENECLADVKNELWELIPDPRQAKEYVDLFMRKFDGIEFPPNIHTFGVEFEISETNPYKIAIDKQCAAGRMTEDEAYYVLAHTKCIIANLHSLLETLKGIFNELVPGYYQEHQSSQRKSNDYTLDKDKLSSHLMASWKKDGNENLLFEDINKCLEYGNSKKIAAIANVIYLSGAIGSGRNRPSTFTKWLDIFEDICGGNFTKYPPNKLKKEIAEAKQLLYYLEKTTK